MSLWGKARDGAPRALQPEPAGHAPHATAEPRELIAAPARAIGAVRPAELAWVLAVPGALLTLAAVVLLGAPLGRALFPPDGAHFLAHGIRPESAEHMRYLIAAGAPFLLAAALAAMHGRVAGVASGWRGAARAAEVLLLAFVALTLVALRVWTYGAQLEDEYRARVYFTIPSIAVAAALAAGLVAVLRRDAWVERLSALAHETPTRRIAASAAALLFCAIWLLTAFNTEGSIGLADPAVRDNVPFWLDETFAVLDGQAPLVGFHAQYAQLWPWVTAGAMAAVGSTFAVYSGVMIAATLATMTAVYATLRRLVGSSLLALALFAPFLATSFFKERGTLADRYGPSNLFSLFPIRYGGPYVLAYLLARRLQGQRPRSAVLLALFAGLVVVNNPEFGVPAFAATLAALVVTLPRPTPRAVARVAGATALGLAGALAAVALFTLVAAGSLPHFGQLGEFSRIYGLDGFGMLPMPGFGFHYAIYVTFAAALVLAAVRALERRRDVLLTGLLCWIGVFGLGAGGYYAGRSHTDVLIDLFSPWALALALLLVVAVRAIRARPSRLPTAAEVAVLVGFGLAACSIAQTPTPWSQLHRIRESAAEQPFRPLLAEAFVRRHTTRGERVMIAVDLGHRIAYDVGVDDRFPYANRESMPTNDQWLLAVRTAQREHVRALFVPTPFIPGVVQEMRAAGYRIAAADRADARIVQLVR